MALRHSSVRRSAAAVAVTVCLALFAAGCSDEPESDPEAEPTQTSEAPTTPSSSPSASETPEPETAKAFIRRWQKISDQMQVSGDTSEFRKLSTRLCDSCQTVADRVDEIYEAGGHVEYAGSKILSLKRNGGTKRKPKFEMERRAGKVAIVEMSGAEPVRGTPVTDTYVVILKRHKDSWKIQTLLRRAE